MRRSRVWHRGWTVALGWLIACAVGERRSLADVYARLPHGPGFCNVRDCGAKGDGVTDDTRAFVRALEEGRGHQGHKAPANVYIPPGTYLVSDTLIVWRATLLAGERSMLIDTTFANDNRTQSLNWRISGGGFFENLWNPGASGDGLEITSTGRTWLYSVQQEHYPGTALILRGAKHVRALGLQFEISSRYVLIDRCEDVRLYQTIAGNWQQQVPSLVHVVGGRSILLVNSAVCQADAVITEKPHGWTAGPRSNDRGFARYTVWVAGNKEVRPEGGRPP